jgi:hypothetical protein
MRVNEIDTFRQNFFDKIIEEQKEKEKQQIKLQKECYHRYEILEAYPNGYQKRICSKCDHTAIKHLRVWEGTKHCILS